MNKIVIYKLFTCIHRIHIRMWRKYIRNGVKMMAKNYSGRPSKSFIGGSNVYHGASRSQSGNKNYSFFGQTHQNKMSKSGYGQQSSLERLLLGNEKKKANKKKNGWL